MKKNIIISVAVAGILVSGCSNVAKNDPLVKEIYKEAKVSIDRNYNTKFGYTMRGDKFNVVGFAIDKDVLRPGCVDNLPCLETNGEFFTIKEIRELAHSNNKITREGIVINKGIVCGTKESNKNLCDADFTIVTPTDAVFAVVVPIGATIMNFGMNWIAGQKIGYEKRIDFDKLDKIFEDNQNIIHEHFASLSQRRVQEEKQKQIDMFK